MVPKGGLLLRGVSLYKIMFAMSWRIRNPQKYR